MFDRLFSSFYSFAHQHKRNVLGLILLLTLAAGAGLVVIRYEGSIDQMLPPDPEVTRSLDFLRESNLSDKVIVSLALTDPNRSRRELFQAVDQLAAALTPPLFTQVVTGVNVAGAMDEFSMLRYAPQILGADDLAAVERMLTPETVQAKLRAIYLQALRPESVMMTSLSRSDPLGIKMLFLDKLRALPSSMGYDVTVEEGHFLSRDGRHALMIIQTPVPMMDSQGSQQMVEALHAAITTLPAFVTADIVCGHLHTIGNEAAIKHDIMLASTIASVAFLLLFFLWFRDPRVLFVFVIPLIAVVWSIALATIAHGKVLYLIIGFGTAIAGISIDFGLHVYICLRQGAGSDRMQRLAKLLAINALTTICGFAILYASLIRGYHQLAFFSILCVVFCFALSLFALPLALGGGPAAATGTPPREGCARGFRWLTGSDRWSIGVWLLLSGLALAGAFTVRFESDLKHLDGSGPTVLATEERFFATWGGRSSQAIFVATGRSVEEAMTSNDRIFREASAMLPAGQFTSLAQFWPSAQTRQENALRWNRFWQEGRMETLRALLNANGTAYGFAEEAFAPFFDGLAHPHAALSPGEMVVQLRERFVVERPGHVSVLSFFPDDEDHVAMLKRLAERHPGTFIVSRKALSTAISAFTTKELQVLAPLAVLVNIVLTWLFFRGWRETAIALAPVATAMVWLVGLMAQLQLPLNVVNLVAAVIATGVIVDYGLGMTYEYRHNLHIGTAKAVTLSAVTSVIGSGALLFASHPALFSTGVAMVISMLSGYLTAVLVVPALCRQLGVAHQPGWRQG